MRRLKGVRKIKSIHNRGAMLKLMVMTFQKSYKNAQGDPKNRFETGCKETDDVLRNMMNAEPQKKAFYMIAVDDFKKYLLDLVENEALIARAVEAAKPVPGEVGTVNV